MGFLDLARMDWSDELLETVGLDRSKLPRLVAPGRKIGVVSREAASETGLKAGTPVIAGGGDGQCAGAGVDVFAPAPRLCQSRHRRRLRQATRKTYAHDRAFRTLIAVGDGGYIYESCIRTGTFLVNWMMQELFAVPPSETAPCLQALEAEAAAIPVGAGGLVVVPYWSGCMTPWWDSNARGVIAGLTVLASPRRMSIAPCSKASRSSRRCRATAIAATGSPIDEFVAIGGGAASDLWCQILADCTGRAVHRSATVEASSLGAAIAAAKGAGWYRDRSATPPPRWPASRSRPSSPSRSARARYRELLAIYQDLWPTHERLECAACRLCRRDERNG